MPKKEDVPVEESSVEENLPADEAQAEEAPPPPQYMTRGEAESLLQTKEESFKQLIADRDRQWQSVADRADFHAKRVQELDAYNRQLQQQVKQNEELYLEQFDPEALKMRRLVEGEFRRRMPPPQQVPQQAPQTQAIVSQDEVAAELANVGLSYEQGLKDPRIDWKTPLTFARSIHKIASSMVTEVEEKVQEEKSTPPPKAPPVETSVARGRKPRQYTTQDIAAMSADEYAEAVRSGEAQWKGE